MEHRVTVGHGDIVEQGVVATRSLISISLVDQDEWAAVLAVGAAADSKLHHLVKFGLGDAGVLRGKASGPRVNWRTRCLYVVEHPMLWRGGERGGGEVRELCQEAAVAVVSLGD